MYWKDFLLTYQVKRPSIMLKSSAKIVCLSFPRNFWSFSKIIVFRWGFCWHIYVNYLEDILLKLNWPFYYFSFFVFCGINYSINQFEFSFIKIATPDDFGMGPEGQKEFSFQSFSQLFTDSGVECVSWRKAIYIFLFLISLKVSILLLSMWSPLTFSVVMFSCIVGSCWMPWCLLLAIMLMSMDMVKWFWLS